MTTTEAERIESIRALYAENGELARAFLEGRAKVLTNFLLGLGGLFILLQWMQTVESFRWLTFLPVAIGAMYSFVCGIMSRINGHLLSDGWEVGERLERELEPEGGFFARSNRTYEHRVSFNTLLAWVYFGTGLLLLLFAASLIWNLIR